MSDWQGRHSESASKHVQQNMCNLHQLETNDDRKVEKVDLPRLYRVSQARLDAKGDVTLDAWKAMTGNSVQAKL